MDAHVVRVGEVFFKFHKMFVFNLLGSISFSNRRRRNVAEYFFGVANPNFIGVIFFRHTKSKLLSPPLMSRIFYQKREGTNKPC